MMQSITDSLIMSKNVQGAVYVLEKGLDIVSCVQYGRDLKSFLDDGYHIRLSFVETEYVLDNLVLVKEMEDKNNDR